MLPHLVDAAAHLLAVGLVSISLFWIAMFLTVVPDSPVELAFTWIPIAQLP